MISAIARHHIAVLRTLGRIEYQFYKYCGASHLGRITFRIGPVIKNRQGSSGEGSLMTLVGFVSLGRRGSGNDHRDFNKP